MALKVAGCEWCYKFLVMQARNDDDDDGHPGHLLYMPMIKRLQV